VGEEGGVGGVVGVGEAVAGDRRELGRLAREDALHGTLEVFVYYSNSIRWYII
jgi:hypothetical protein